MIKPLSNYVLLKKEVIENTTKSGIILATSESQEDNVGVVVAVGPGKVVDGQTVAMTVKESDKVIFDKYATTTIKYQDEEYLLIEESKILAVVE